MIGLPDSAEADGDLEAIRPGRHGSILSSRAFSTKFITLDMIQTSKPVSFLLKYQYSDLLKEAFLSRDFTVPDACTILSLGM
ncbi:MAG: hypothetical protein JWM11_2606 [Planctomycetaceae bacterium]|nr:hypothetical protein [Planctomycetaceae bacterium]